jgi:hypothetical protein
MSTPVMTTSAILGGAPGESWPDRLRLAGLRAIRTLLQGVVAAFPTAGAGTLVLTSTYWETFLFAILGGRRSPPSLPSSRTRRPSCPPIRPNG